MYQILMRAKEVDCGNGWEGDINAVVRAHLDSLATAGEPLFKIVDNNHMYWSLYRDDKGIIWKSIGLYDELHADVKKEIEYQRHGAWAGEAPELPYEIEMTWWQCRE